MTGYKDAFKAAFPELMRRFMNETGIDKDTLEDITDNTRRQVDNWLSGNRFIGADSLATLIMFSELNESAREGYAYLVPAPELLQEILSGGEGGETAGAEPVTASVPRRTPMTMSEMTAAFG